MMDLVGHVVHRLSLFVLGERLVMNVAEYVSKIIVALRVPNITLESLF